MPTAVDEDRSDDTLDSICSRFRRVEEPDLGYKIIVDEELRFFQCTIEVLGEQRRRVQQVSVKSEDFESQIPERRVADQDCSETSEMRWCGGRKASAQSINDEVVENSYGNGPSVENI